MDIKSGIVAKRIMAVLAGLAVLSLAGCAPAPRMDTSKAERIVADSSLRGKIQLSEASYRREGRFSQAQVVAQNETGKGIIFEYQFNWMDANGFVLSEDRMWHQATLSPYGRVNLTSTASTAEGVKIRVSIRRPYEEF